MDAIVLVKDSLVSFFGKEKTSTFEDKILLNESRMKDLKGFVYFSLIEGIILMIITMILCAMYLSFGPDRFIFIGAGAFVLPFAVNYLVQDVIFEKRKRKKEELLPDLLLEASVFCDEISFPNTIKRLSEQDFDLLSKDFQRAANEIQNGASIEEALTRTKQLNKSKSIDRVIDLLLSAQKSGAHVSDSLKETAEDLLEAQAILKERQAVMLVTKYTLIFSSAIIVPCIIGVIIGLVSGLNFSSMGDIGIGLSPTERVAIFEAAKLGALIYVIEYALLGSYFLALGEANKKQFFVYAPVITIVALSLFFGAQSF